MEIGRSIATQIAAHNVLTTGVHGVEDDYVALTSQEDQSLSDAEIPAAICRDVEAILQSLLTTRGDIPIKGLVLAERLPKPTTGEYLKATATGYEGAIPPGPVGLEATVALFQANAATGTADTSEGVNDNNDAGTIVSFDAIDEYVEVNFAKVVSIKRWRWKDGAVTNTGDGRWKIQYYSLATHAWVDWVTEIPTLTTAAAWREFTTETEVLTDKVRIIATAIDTVGSNLIWEGEIIY